MKSIVEHHKTATGNGIDGYLLEPGDVLQHVDVFESADGTWQRCPMPNTQLSSTAIKWVRPIGVFVIPGAPTKLYLNGVELKRDDEPEAEPPARPATAALKTFVAALDHINEHRKDCHQAKLDPVKSSWTYDDVIIEAERLGWRVKGDETKSLATSDEKLTEWFVKFAELIASES